MNQIGCTDETANPLYIGRPAVIIGRSFGNTCDGRFGSPAHVGESEHDPFYMLQLDGVYVGPVWACWTEELEPAPNVDIPTAA